MTVGLNRNFFAAVASNDQLNPPGEALSALESDYDKDIDREEDAKKGEADPNDENQLEISEF